MRQLPLPAVLIFTVALILQMSACGGGGSTNNTTATKVVISPTALSLNRGEVGSVSATSFNSSNAQVSADVIYTSSNSSLASISPAGSVCAGKWDTNFVVCTPATATGTATVTVSVAKNTSVTATSTVYVHERVDRVELNATSSSCLSSGQTELLTATAFSLDPAVCSSLGSTVPCALSNASLGQFTFSTADPDVVSIDNVTVPGTASGKGTGLTTVVASVSGVNSAAQPFLVCPITQLSFLNGDTQDTAPFTLAKAATKTMNVIAVDSNGTTLTNPPVSYFSGNSYGMTVSAGTSTSTATVTAVNSGVNAFLYAACVPPGCNKNLNAVYSPGIVGTVSGTYNSPTIFVASTKSLNLFPIDASNNTVGTVVTLPYLPNTFLMNRQGTKAVMGSDSNPLMLLDPAGPTVSTIPGIVGAKALAISPDGVYALVSNTTNTYLINLNTSAATFVSTFGGATKAAFSPDSKFALFTRGTGTLYAVDISSTKGLIFTEGGVINDIAVLANGSLTYLAQPGAINALGTCNFQNPGFADSRPATSPSLLTTIPTGTGVLGIDGTNLLYVNATNVSEACPPAVTETSSSIALGVTPQQLLATFDGTKAIIPGNANQVAVVTLSTQAVANATLKAGNVSGKGDVTPDNASLYIGGTDNAVHKIDLGSASDTAQIAVSLKDANSAVVAPDLVVVRSK